MSMKFSGELLARLRARRGWSQAQFAKQSGIAAAQISRYELGENEPRPIAIAKMAKCLNVAEDSLFRDLSDDSASCVNGPELLEVEFFPEYNEFVNAAKAIQTVKAAQFTEAALRLEIACQAFEQAFKRWAHTR